MTYKPMPVPIVEKPAKGLRKSSQKTYEYITTKALLEGKTTEEIIAWAERNIHADLPKGTVVTRFSAIKRLLLARGYSPLDVRAVLPPIDKHVGDKPKLPLSNDHLKLFETIVQKSVRAPAVRTLLLLLPLTGMRVTEACTLKHANMVVDEGIPSLVVLGKGGKYRIIPLSERAQQILNAYLAEEKPPIPWLFHGTAPGEPLNRLQVSSACYRLRTSHPELGRLSPHTLRHTFATRAYRRGISLIVISRLMGHASVAQTEKYIKLSPEYVAKQLEKMR